MITIENADKALKDYYLQAVTAQLNNNVSPFFSAIEKSTANVFGKDVKISVIRDGSLSVQACAEDADLPSPYSNRYYEISLPLKNIYGTIMISDKALRASRDSAGAFVNLVNAEMEGLISGAQFNFKRMLYGDGNGTLCKILDRDTEFDDIIIADYVKDWFLGIRADILPETGESNYPENLNRPIVEVNKKEKKIGFTGGEIMGSESFSTGYLAIHGAAGNELTGLAAIFDSKTLYGYNKKNEPYFKPYEVKLGSSDSITEDILTDILDNMEENFNSKINMILCSYATRKKIAALIANDKRVVNSIDAHTGVGEVTVNGVPVYADTFCPENVIYFVNTDDFVLSQLCDWEWLEDEDGKILKQVPGKAAYSATLVKYAELICKKPCGQAVLRLS